MSVSPQEAAKELLRRRKARNDLLSFAMFTHPNWVRGEHHIEICRKLEEVEQGKIKRLMIFAPPRHSKSELATRRFPAWYLGRNPTRQVICASHTTDLAKDMGADIRDIVAEPEYQGIFPGVLLNKDAKSAGRWRTTAGGICVAVGAKAAVVGRGAHLLVLDDILSGRNSAESPRERELIWRWYVGDAYQRLMPGGAIVFMTTRWHEDDPAGRALKTENWDVIKCPAILNQGADDEQALWPEQYSLKDLQAKRQVFITGGRTRDWEAQYQQNPTVREGTFLKRRYFEDAKYTKRPDNMRIYMSADFAVTAAEEGKSPDRTEIGVFGFAEDEKIYILDWWSGAVASDVWVEKLIDMMLEWQPMTVFSEKGQIRKSIEPFLERRMRERKCYSYFEWMPTMHDKLVRGQSFHDWAARGRVRLPHDQLWAEEFISEVCLVGAGGRYDDKFDCAANVFLAISVLQSATPPTPLEKRAAVRDYAEVEDMLVDSKEWMLA